LATVLTLAERLDEAEVQYRGAIAFGQAAIAGPAALSLGVLLLEQDRDEEAQTAFRESIAWAKAAEYDMAGGTVEHGVIDLAIGRGSADIIEAASGLLALMATDGQADVDGPG
jgi:hypothetical protein